MDDVRQAIEAVFRQESGRIIAFLIRISGSFDLAEDAMHDAMLAALNRWPQTGLPRNPAGWITAAAQRKVLDYARRERTRRNKEDALQYEIESAAASSDPDGQADDMFIPDDRLRLLFTCCHPALNRQAHVASTLRTLGGLTTPEIARAFLLPEPTLARRLVRAKRKIEQARIPYGVPPPHQLAERLRSVQSVLYLIFNEGYESSQGDDLIRRELCAEAIRLARTLCQLLPAEPENTGLLALMLLHDSRRDARVNAQGELITLDEQDRSLWKRDQIAEGLRLVDEALLRHQPGPYQLQAAIAALHAQAEAPDQTDWVQIAALYERLLEMQPSPVIALNHGVAVAFAYDLAKGLAMIDSLEGSGVLDSYPLHHAARGDLLRRLGRLAESADAYKRALSLTSNAVERRFLKRRLAEVEIARTQVAI